MTTPEKSRNPLQRWVRVVRARPRLFLAILLGLGVLSLLPAEWRLATRSLVAWDIALGLYLVLAFRLMMNCDVNRIKRRAAHQDEGRITILVLVVASALASLLAILAELGGANRQPAHLALAAIRSCCPGLSPTRFSRSTMPMSTTAKKHTRAAV